MKNEPSFVDAYDLTHQLLSDHRLRVHRSHEAFLEYGHSAMQTEKEAIFLKMALSQQRGYRHLETEESPRSQPSRAPIPEAQFSQELLQEFATGSLVKCFGDHYNIYEGRRSPRTPNGDLLLISRVLEVKGKRGAFKQGASLVSEYDVPVDAWYYTQNAYPVMPYSIVMEIALQPCGFLATYMGCTLIYPDVELFFRNLDSKAKMLREVDVRGKTITATSTLTSVVHSAETVIVQFDYALLLEGVPFYSGATTFGYFTPGSLANQVGMDKGDKKLPWYQEVGAQDPQGVIDLKTMESRSRYFQGSPQQPFFKQAGGQLEFLDRLRIVSDGGKYQKGYIYGEKVVDPGDWFYPCHFYQDPVMPGSLGVESILQCLRLFAINQNLGAGFVSPAFSNAVSEVVWKYRGQIIQSNQLMSIEAHIKKIEREGDKIVVTADANLWKDGLRIYEITDAAIVIMETAR